MAVRAFVGMCVCACVVSVQFQLYYYYVSIIFFCCNHLSVSLNYSTWIDRAAYLYVRNPDLLAGKNIIQEALLSLTG